MGSRLCSGQLPISTSLGNDPERRPPPSETARRPFSMVHRLLDVIDQIQIGKRTAVFIDVVISIGSDQNGADIGDPGNVWWHELLPGLSASRSQVQLVDFGRHFAKSIHEE